MTKSMIEYIGQAQWNVQMHFNDLESQLNISWTGFNILTAKLMFDFCFCFYFLTGYKTKKE